jgi:hypothetical protein
MRRILLLFQLNLKDIMQAKDNAFFGVINFRSVYNTFFSSDFPVKYVFYWPWISFNLAFN